MYYSDTQVVLHGHAWLQQNHAVYLVTVLDTWGSSPRPAGSIAAIRDDGLIAGSVSGGCVEDVLLERLVNKPDITRFPHEITFGVDYAERERLKLPCGGSLTVLIEKLHGINELQTLVSAINKRQPLQRIVNRVTGHVRWSNATDPQNAFYYDGLFVVKAFRTRWRLLLIGAGQLSQLVAQFATTLGYELIVCDPRANYPKDWNMPGVQFVDMMPDDAVNALCHDARTGVIALTHDPRLDDMALMEALKSRAFFVGALGSKKSSDERRARLALLDLSAAEIARLHGPVGLPIGSKTPEEIALSIMADVTAEKNKLLAYATRAMEEAMSA